MASARVPNISGGATKALAMEYAKLTEEPVEGFQVKLANDCNLFEWEVVLFGPPNTLYQEGYFKAKMKFPQEYPYSPPSFRFITKMWHPNVYENGEVCISILHPPVDDPHSGELLSERWNPTQNVRTILLSVISLLNEPNTYSPANVDASVMYRKWKEAPHRDMEYRNIIMKQVQATKSDAERDGVTVPKTLEEYCFNSNASKPTGAGSSNYVQPQDFDYDSDIFNDDLDEDDDDDNYPNCYDDSGNSES